MTLRRSSVPRSRSACDDPDNLVNVLAAELVKVTQIFRVVGPHTGPVLNVVGLKVVIKGDSLKMHVE